MSPPQWRRVRLLRTVTPRWRGANTPCRARRGTYAAEHVQDEGARARKRGSARRRPELACIDAPRQIALSVGAIAMNSSTIIVAVNAQLLRGLKLQREKLSVQKLAPVQNETYYVTLEKTLLPFLAAHRG
jgi:hypothetical protein